MAVAELKAHAAARKQAARLSIEIVTVTPAVAKEWLISNTENRLASRRLIGAYARDMAAGNWRMTGDAIRFDTKGLLLDGQQRLMGCVEAGVAFVTPVIRGLDKDARLAMDTGRPRNLGDYLRITGTPCAFNLGATTKVLWLIKTGVSHGRPTNQELLDIIERHPDLGDWILDTHAIRTFTGGPASIVCAVAYAGMLHGHDEQARRFVEVFKTGVPSYKGDAAHALRERNLRVLRRVPGSRVKRHVEIWSICHAWNLFVKRTRLAKFPLPTRAVIIDHLQPDKI